MEKCIEVCRASINRGRFNRDEASALKAMITPAHIYIEKNIHGIFERIVIDCWIDFICRQNKIDEATLWDSFSSCKNEFESVLFTRLCEYRYNKSINQWTNLVRIQEYARKKVEFIFGKRLQNRSVAAANSGYFDLIFNVAANEMGCGEFSTSKVYAGLRTPNSPFLMTKLSRNIMQKILPELDIDENISSSPHIDNTDRVSMDVFAAIKNIIPDEPDSLISANAIMRIPQRVYIPEGLKSVIDLEIDALLENGAVIQKCERCHEYFLKDDDYNYNYCLRLDNGRTCLEISGEKAIAATTNAVTDPAVLHARCDQLYKEMSERVNVDINQRDFSDWYKYMTLIRENVLTGLASMDDFENFAEYSHTISFPPRGYITRKARSTNERDDEGNSEAKREVHAFEFERIERRPQNPYYYPTPPPLPLSAPIPYSPVKTTRVIRGVSPSGVKDLSQSYSPTPATDFSLSEPSVESGESSIDLPPISEQPEQNGVNDTEAVREFKKEGQPEKVVTAPPAYKKVKRITEGRAKTRINKYGKGLLLKNPYESEGMLQNPFIRDLIKPEEDDEAADVNSKDAGIATEFGEIKAPPLLSPAFVSDAGNNAKISETRELQSPLSEPSEASIPKLDFSNILTGIKRNDVFDGGEPPESADDAVLSHKTKRVMDTVFGKSEIINPFVKAGENDD
ncbi:MAG: DUF6076 domain-containing protein [Oscillospiraceae bacterium]|nr:DUF6076 domain-containing protein [Oscillospiraceae bacterium]